ncbi:acyl-CoA dehydrogenase [Aestuariispira insulae]|uniref:Acyl-coenzyme A dehydrogenase n=1 Tax=Aestuariispira insulae TaxID=1461337 RepID=A0A3D9HPC8_9PROT|nr:acyl-CoA dehydrogenase [Aestuariispira insulae]RED50746.1 acyl-CoA dehydrogenase [Aestuariispira insulae]
MTALLILLAVVLLVLFCFFGYGYVAWTVSAVLLLAAWAQQGGTDGFLLPLLGLIMAAIAVVTGLGNLRRQMVTKPLMKFVKGLLPRMGETERIALEAGTVWWDGDLFSGQPDWRKLMDFPITPLSDEEQAFLDGPVEQLCKMLDDWEIQQKRDLPPEIWDFMRKHGFFGMIIPKIYGGLEFSAIGHSAVVVKLASRSITAAVTVMVPNSLGPAELLLHYGTDKQRKHYLPRLADGRDIPCFALTEPHAGSDAAASRSIGTIVEKTIGRKKTLGIQLSWSKRYITLAPVATCIGLAFRLYDPDHLLGDDEDLGITCALIPRDVKGITIGERHDPMGIPFQNGPILGKDVFIPLDQVIGGRDGVGRGWMMLMDCLAAGRSISLPSLSVSAVQTVCRHSATYASVREQFNMQIGRFEGIQEPLARMAGNAYWMNAARRMTCGAVDAGEKPSVVSAIVKAYLTDSMRQSVTDALDIAAGSGICRGPGNNLSRAHNAVPIAITVEGANILTRSMIIFGQGAIRSHPFIQREMHAIAKGDIKSFDDAFFDHINFVSRNAARSLVLGMTNGHGSATPSSGPEARYFRKLNRYSAGFALLTDIALASMGGALKRREKLSGRYADALSWMYIASSALKRFHDEGCQADDRHLLDWSCTQANYHIEEAFDGILANMPNRWLGYLLRPLLFPLGRRQKPPSDRIGAKIANAILDRGPTRERICGDMYLPDPEEEGLGQMMAAEAALMKSKPARQKIRAALKVGQIPAEPLATQAQRAFDADIITSDEFTDLQAALSLQDQVIQVRAYKPTAHARLKG